MKRTLLLLALTAALFLCAACQTPAAKETPLPIASSAVKDMPELGESYSQVTDYDDQGRVLRESVLYSGEYFFGIQMMEIDPETGEFVPSDPDSVETVENKTVAYSLYDYDGEDYAVRIREYQAEYPDTPKKVTQKDALDRVTLLETHRNFHWGITEDFYRFRFAYEEDSSDVAVTILTSFVPDSRPGTKPVTHTAQYTVSLGADAYTVSSAALSYGADGVSSFGIYEADKDGNALRASFYDQDGALTQTLPVNGDEPLTE